MSVVINGIALIATDYRTILPGQLLVTRIGGSFVRSFDLASGAFGGLFRLVVGAGVVFVFHIRPTMAAHPATNHSPTCKLPIHNPSNSLPRSGLVQQVADGDAEEAV